RNFQDPDRFTTEENVDALSANLDFENKKMGDLRMYYGLEYIFNKVGSDGSQQNIDSGTVSDAPSRYPDGSTWQSAAAYISAEYKTKPNFTLLSGLRYNHIWLAADFDNSFYPFPFTSTRSDNGALTGSIGFSWFPKASLQITVNGSSGFRSPNIDDIGKVFDSEPGSVVVPNPDLKPEYAYNAELGIRKNFKDKLVLKGAAYYTYLDNALVRRDFTFNGQSQIIYNGELSDVQAIQNAAKAYVYGIELGLEAFVTEHWSVRANYTLADGTEEDDSGVALPVRHVAPSFGDLHVLWKNQRIQADLFVNFNGEIPFENLALSERNKPFLYDSDADGNPFSPSWYTLNFRSQYQISKNLNANFNIENITDQRYRPYSSGIAGPGINFILGLGISL
ncbi:MAG: TonB-dependent receptor, partial [Flavobacteriaceae bacterium]